MTAYYFKCFAKFLKFEFILFIFQNIFSLIYQHKNETF